MTQRVQPTLNLQGQVFTGTEVVGESGEDGGYLNYVDERVGGVPAAIGSGISAAGTVNIARDGVDRAFINANGTGLEGSPTNPLDVFGSPARLRATDARLQLDDTTRNFGLRNTGGFYDHHDFVAGTFRERWDIANLRRGILRTPTGQPLEAEGGIQSLGSDAALWTSSRSGTDVGLGYALYANNGSGRLWRNADRALFNDSQWGMFGTPGQALHVFGGVSRIEAAGQVRLDLNNTLIGQAAGLEHNNDTNTLDMVRLGVARVLTMPTNANRIGVARTPANTFEAEGVVYSRGSAASLVVERRDSLGNNAQLYSDGGAVRLFDSVGSADRVQWARDTGKMAIGATPGTAFLKIEGDDWIDANKRVADPRRLLASHVSYRPLSNPLTATDAGATATVNIAAFTQRVAGVDVSVSAGSISSLSFDTLYFIYYDDAGFAGGSVTYNATTVKETALNGSGRFFIGSIRTPKDGSPDTIGNDDGGAGAQFGGTQQFFAQTITTAGSPTSPNLSRDGDFTTKAVMPVDGNGTDTMLIEHSAFAGIRKNWKTLKIKIRTEVKNIAGTVTRVRARYSLDAKGSWTDIFDVVVARALQTDEVSIPVGQAIGQVFLEFNATVPVGAGNTATLDLYEAWLEGAD